MLRTRAEAARDVGWTILYGGTLFLSAALLFSVQPMVAKMVLPRLGGTPAVWNTCMLFFQTALLAGYAYAHLAPTRLGTRRHATVHLLLLAAALPLLPLGVQGTPPPGGANPVPWLLGVLAAGVGFPFLLVSTTAPLLQRWFALTRARAAADPYFLYGASNLGSLAALLAYPLLLEPRWRLAEQSRAWSLGFVLLLALVAACALVMARSPGAASSSAATPARRAPAVPPLRIARWVALAFVPSSLLLGVTTHLTTDVAAVPLLWVVPLALYLLSFVVAFTRVPELVREDGRVWLPVMALALVGAIIADITVALPLLLPFNLVAFFLAALLCHGELAAERPATEQLTAFYLWMSVGGVLGGLFNAAVAPLVFDSIVEYPLVLALAVTAVPAVRSSGWRRADVIAPLAVALMAGALAAVVLPRVEEAHGVQGRLIVLAVPLLACFALIRSPRRFGLALAGVVIATSLASAGDPRRLHRDRDFFGVVTVEEEPDLRAHRLYHGHILHGEQRVENPRMAVGYYHAQGPIGQLFGVLGPDARSVGVVGLGAGTLASYGRGGQRFVYYEISPAVARVARDTRLFTYLRDSAADVELVMGDARVRLVEASPGAYDLLVIDAFSSDAIPVHLLTREAFALYGTKLAPDGVLTVHVSNRFLDLEPVVWAIAREAGWATAVRRDATAGGPDRSPSVWIVLARDPAHLQPLTRDPRWGELRRDAGVAPWTDDFSNLIRVFRWNGSATGSEPAANDDAATQAASVPSASGRS